MPVAAPATSNTRRVGPAPRLDQMQPGKLFRLAGDQHRVLALLSHSGQGVADSKRVWCVVVAAAPQSTDQAGAMVDVPRSALVDRLRVEEQLRLSVED